MKTLFPLFLSVLLWFSGARAGASLLTMVTVKQPVYMNTDGDAEIRIVDTQAVVSIGVREVIFSAIAQPHRPVTVPGLTEKYAEQDINLTSLYGIKVSGESPPEGGELTVTIDASNAKVPENYPFTIEQVVDSVTTCVKLMQPAQPEGALKFSIKVIPAGGAAAAAAAALPPREPEAALTEFRSDLTELGKWVGEWSDKVAKDSKTGVEAFPEFSGKVSKIRLDGLPEDCAGEFRKFVEAVNDAGGLVKEFLEGVKQGKCAARDPEWEEKMLVANKRISGSLKKLKEIGGKYGLKELFEKLDYSGR